jgi:hypothetical protein
VWGISQLPEEISASQEGLYANELVVGQYNLYWTLKLNFIDILKMTYRTKG